MTDKTKEAVVGIINVYADNGMEESEALAKICAIVDEERKGIPTADLLAELEKRRPDCDKCGPHGDNRCMFCIWQGEGLHKDNFKPSK